jgi:hypothetical protein
MRPATVRFIGLGLSLAASLLLVTPGNSFAADSDLAVIQGDRAFVQAVAKGDAGAVGKLLDAGFTWTDVDGKTIAGDEVLRAVPTDSLGDESGAEVSERTYGQVGAVQASHGKIHILRMWVQRAGGWRLLVYHEVKQPDQPSNSPGSGVKDCENPCKTVPFQPANEAEQSIIASWQALETGVTAHDADAWAPHIADEFVQISSNSDHVISKAGRIETLNKQKASGVGSAPAPLVSAKMFDFGSAVIMTCLHQPYSGKPIHVSRLWINRDGKWIMSISYQTTIQAAAAK